MLRPRDGLEDLGCRSEDSLHTLRKVLLGTTGIAHVPCVDDAKQPRDRKNPMGPKEGQGCLLGNGSASS